MKKLFSLLAFLLIITISTASELFIRVSSNVEFYASVQNQTIYNTKNLFKFYDLVMGNTTILILNRSTNGVLMNATISLGANERLVIEVTPTGVMNILQRIPIQEVNWYTVFDQPQIGNNYGGNYPLPMPPINLPNNWNNNGPYNNQSSVHPTYFQHVLESLQRETMDSGKLKTAKNFVKNNRITSEQIAQILKKFSFDSNRLEFAKYAHDYCIDKQHYFLLKESFDFSSNYNNLLKYIEGR